VVIVMMIGQSGTGAGKNTDSGKGGQAAPPATLNSVTHDAVS
jgi:hypothetical protein